MIKKVVELFQVVVLILTTEGKVLSSKKYLKSSPYVFCEKTMFPLYHQLKWLRLKQSDEFCAKSEPFPANLSQHWSSSLMGTFLTSPLKRSRVQEFPTFFTKYQARSTYQEAKIMLMRPLTWFTLQLPCLNIQITAIYKTSSSRSQHQVPPENSKRRRVFIAANWSLINIASRLQEREMSRDWCMGSYSINSWWGFTNHAYHLIAVGNVVSRHNG